MAEEMKILREAGFSLKQIGNNFGVSHGTVLFTLSGKRKTPFSRPSSEISEVLKNNQNLINDKSSPK